MENFDHRIDAYIGKSAEFAQPVLIHLRELVHQACPGITETMKWSVPFFDYQGTVCQMAAFKQHCAFGFWKAGMLSDPDKVLKTAIDEASAGSIGKITSLADLPADEILIAYIKEAVQLNESNVKAPPRFTPKPAAEQKEMMPPEEFLALLDANPIANEHFDKFSASKQREYVEWFVDAKTEATKLKRIQTALEWISEGKSRHWKYQG